MFFEVESPIKETSSYSFIKSTNDPEQLIGDDNPRCSTVFTFEPHQLSFHHPYNTSESAFQEIVGNLEEQRVNVVDDYLRTILHRVKKEAKLSEVEYGKLIMMIECGQLVGVCDLLEKCLKTFYLL